MKKRFLLLILAHGLTQIGISLPDETWRQWMQASPQAIAACTYLLFAIRLTADLALCAWIAGPERRGQIWNALHSRDSEKSHAT